MTEMEREMMELEAMNQEIAATCKSEEDVYALFSSSMLPEGEELSEDDLEMVAGGMSNAQAIAIVAGAYWDLCILKKKKTKYSASQIYEAINKCDKINTKIKNVSIEALKWAAKKVFG